MEIKVKKIDVNHQNMTKYLGDNNVIRKTNLRSSLRFGKLVMCADADADG
jgi:DNA gyrase/topoisomerase IV subunit B